ncbi:MAG: hypothetical protein M5U12_34890 [Verrucomicrobia bacterium]|nr:hypothetical protein [Verrucomicrobiota bacterium]
MRISQPLLLAAVLLAAPPAVPRADGLVVPDVALSLARSGDALTLSWRTLSVITNAGRTPVFPRYVVEASTDLTYWWSTAVDIPQRVGGPSLTIQTNFTIPPCCRLPSCACAASWSWREPISPTPTFGGWTSAA